MDGYRKSSHAVYDIKFHVIWVTKYRYKVLWSNRRKSKGANQTGMEHEESRSYRGA
jgi:REP element-mobilizing transposase RayT